VAAGSALCGSVLGCADYTIEIPCLGPAPPPTPVPGMNYIRASEIGCALDCDLRTGRNKQHGGSATDDAPRINAAMAAASASNPITLIIDGSAMVSGLFLPAGGYWSIAGLGCGTGFYVKSGTNNDGIHNGPPDAAIPFNPGPPVPARGMNVTLSNFTLNGNQGNGGDGDSTTGMRQGTKATWYCGINLMNLNNVTIENVVVVNVPAYHVRLSNVGNVSASGCIFQSQGLSTDGLHFDGPANDITISKCKFETGDDSIALNCPEGYAGDISRVSVTDCTFNSLSLMRLYTTDGNRRFNINNVSVSNCSGQFTAAAFLIGIVPGSNPNAVDGLTIANCNLTASVILAIAENFGTITLNNVTFNPSQENAIWYPPQVNQIPGFLRPSPLYGTVPFVGSNLTFQNCGIYRQSHVDVIPVMLENNSTIANVSFNGFAVLGPQGSNPMIPALLEIGSGSIEQLVLTNLNATEIQTPIAANEFGNIELVSGAGVLATGWEFPNGVMANGVPYISANSGLASIKIGGVVETYPGP
jgi:Glycosyl hydrolases family 28